nr:MAG TPA: hypothetical protein [Caudoviricetes sp.]
MISLKTLNIFSTYYISICTIWRNIQYCIFLFSFKCLSCRYL